MKPHRPLRNALGVFVHSPDTRAPACGAQVRDVIDLKRTMATVLLALSPCIIFAFTRYGVSQLLPLFIVSYGVGLAVEWLFALIRRTEINEGYFVTGALIPLIVPITIPLWQLAVAVAFAVVFAKEAFGGTGHNIFNPALVCRAFLFFAYPAQMTGAVWGSPPPITTAALTSPDVSEDKQSAATPYNPEDNKEDTQSAATPSEADDNKEDKQSAATPYEADDNKEDTLSAATPSEADDNKEDTQSAATPYEADDNKEDTQSAATPSEEMVADLPAEAAKSRDTVDALSTATPTVSLDALSGATPLALANSAPYGGTQALLDEAGYTNSAMLLGRIPGSPGEGNKLAIMFGALLLLLTGIASARVMIAGVLGLVLTATLANLLSAHPTGLFALDAYQHLLMGGFLFGIVFMATDPVTHPETNAGKWAFGFLCGALTILIRLYNPAYVEGTMLAILLMNAFAPALDRGVLAIHIRQRRARRGQ